MSNKEVAESLRKAKLAARNEDLDDVAKHLSEAILTLEAALSNK